jgi:hypothetical protein
MKYEEKADKKEIGEWGMDRILYFVIKHMHALGGVKSVCCIACGMGILNRRGSAREYGYNAEVLYHI